PTDAIEGRSGCRGAVTSLVGKLELLHEQYVMRNWTCVRAGGTVLARRNLDLNPGVERIGFGDSQRSFADALRVPLSHQVGILGQAHLHRVEQRETQLSGRFTRSYNRLGGCYHGGRVRD